MEIIAEFETWRRIRDAEGTEGWVYHSLLSGRRTGDGDHQGGRRPGAALRQARRQGRGDGAARAPAWSRSVKRCSGEGWCCVTGRGFEGYVQQTRLWGVYPEREGRTERNLRRQA